MKRNYIYKTVTVALGIVACISVFSSDRAEKRLSQLRAREEAAVMEIVADGIKEVSYDLSVIYWSADPGNYRDSLRNIGGVCGRIEGAIGVYACDGFEKYLDYCRSLSAYVKSLPYESDDDIRGECLALREMNDRILSGGRSAVQPSEMSLAEFIEKADALAYKPSRYFPSSSGVCAVNSAPLDSSSSSLR